MKKHKETMAAATNHPLPSTVLRRVIERMPLAMEERTKGISQILVHQATSGIHGERNHPMVENLLSLLSLQNLSRHAIASSPQRVKISQCAI